MRLVHHHGRAPEHLVRQHERAGACAAAGVPGEGVPRLLPPDPAVALRRGEPVLRVRDLRVRRVRELVPDPPRVGDADREAHHREHERRDARDALDPHAPARLEPALSQGEGSSRDGRRACEHRQREDPAVVCTRGTCLLVARDAGQRQCDTEDRCSGAGCEGRRQKALDPVAREHDPGRCSETGERHAETRVGEEQRDDEQVEQHDPFDAPPRGKPQREGHPGVADERELVPVVERRAEARETAVVGVEARHALREQRPHGDEPDERRRRTGELLPRQPCADERTEQAERGIDERPVRELPGAIWRDRPDDRDAGPDPEPEQRPQEERARRGEARGPEQEGGCEHERQAADPDDRRVRVPAAEEKRTKADRGRSEPSDPFARGAHGR